MYRFIFVCYNHGAGGENLAVKISKNKKCNNLKYDMMDKRTWSYDYFNKLFLKPFNNNWKEHCTEITKTELIDVIPSHYSPEILKEIFPNEFYVVINYPKTNAGIKHLKENTYKKVWASKHNNLHQKLGYWRTNTSREITKEILKKLNGDITNEEIECLIHNFPATKENIGRLFDEKFAKIKDKFNYSNNENLLIIEYENLNNIENLIENINERI